MAAAPAGRGDALVTFPESAEYVSGPERRCCEREATGGLPEGLPTYGVSSFLMSENVGRNSDTAALLWACVAVTPKALRTYSRANEACEHGTQRGRNTS